MKLVARLLFSVGAAVAVVGTGCALAPLLAVLSADQPLFRAHIQLGESAYSPWLSSADPAMRVGLALTIMPRFAATEMRRDSGGELVDLYRFPLHYRVRDESGNTLIDQWVLVDGSENRTVSQEYSERLNPAPITISTIFDPFSMAPGQAARVEALLLPDRLYGADIELAELRVFRQPLAAMVMIRWGIGGIFAGLALMLLSLVAEFRPAAATAGRTSVVRSARIVTLRPRSAPQQASIPAVAARRREVG